MYLPEGKQQYAALPKDGCFPESSPREVRSPQNQRCMPTQSSPHFPDRTPDASTLGHTSQRAQVSSQILKGDSTDPSYREQISQLLCLEAKSSCLEGIEVWVAYGCAGQGVCSPFGLVG